MKPHPRPLLIPLAILAFWLAACSAPAMSDPTATQLPSASPTAQPSATQVPTATPLPSPTATPTPAPTSTPLPCNLVFDSDRDGNREIYRMDPDGGNLTNLTNEAQADDWDPVWSPDGSQVAFVSYRQADDEKGQFIFVMDADGSHLRQLTHDNGSDFPDWSPDGLRVAYSYAGDIYVIPVNGSAPATRLTASPEKDVRPVWSPDNRQIAYLTGDDFTWNVFVMDADGNNTVQITDNDQVSGVTWTVDGRLLTGWGWNDQEVFCNNCLVDADGTNIEEAGGKGDLQRYVPFWTADGQRVELADIDLLEGNNEIYLVGEIYPDVFLNLTNNPASDLNADWPALCGPNAQAVSQTQPMAAVPVEKATLRLEYAYDAAYIAYSLASGAAIDPKTMEGPSGRTFYLGFSVVTRDNQAEWVRQAQDEPDDH